VKVSNSSKTKKEISRNDSKSSKKKTFGILHQNIQSIGNSLNQLNHLIQDLTGVRVLCVTEHWKTKDELQFFTPHNFKLVSSACRERGEHGGSAIFVHQSIKCKSIIKITKLSKKQIFECSAVDCDINGKEVVVICIYKPPAGNIETFFDCLERALSIIFDVNKMIIITGDFNIEFLKDNKNKHRILSLMNCFNLQHTITANTRITSRSQSCIDNIFVNFPYIQGWA